MKKTLYIMRHGQTLFNQRGKIQGDCDSPLTQLGIEQAISAKSYLDKIDFDHLYCSTSERASDTLELVVGSSRPYTRLKGLKERSFGIFEGESEDLNPTWKDGYDEIFPKYGAESSRNVMDRMRETCIGIMEQANHDTVLAVSHAGASFHFLRNWTTVEQQETIMAEGGFPNCCILKYEYDDYRFEFVEIIRAFD